MRTAIDAQKITAVRMKKDEAADVKALALALARRAAAEEHRRANQREDAAGKRDVAADRERSRHRR